MSRRIALVSGITGQDGSYLAELLLDKGYEVHGLIRRSSSFSTDRIDHLFQDPHEQSVRLRLHYADLTDGTGLRRVIEQVVPHEVYNLGAQSHVKVSYDQPEYTADVDALGVLRMLEAVRDVQHRTGRQIRVYQAGTSEMFGATPPPQNEQSPFHPRSPYAVAKVYAHWQMRNYREAYGMFLSNGILFNHESERRGETFVTRKITRAAARISRGLQKKLFLGNLDAMRDWGHAEDYVQAMWMILQHSEPDDFVIATGNMYSVRDFADRVFGKLDLDYREYVVVDESYFRPAEVEALQGDASKARELLGWQPKTDIDTLVTRMVRHDLNLARQEHVLREAGHAIGQRGAASA